MKVKHVKTLYLVFYLQVITDAYDKKKLFLKYVLERGPPNPQLKPLKIYVQLLFTVVHYIKDAFANGFESFSEWLISLEFK